MITVNSEGGIDLDFRDVETTMRNGGGAIMATGKASGEKRVERAILNAIDSPLLYGNDIGKAKRILFNIYSSDEAPIMVPEMQEIDDFFDQLDPNIEVIWGISTDASLGGDAKVTILATGMEDEKDESEKLPHDDRYYEELIPKLYKPIVKQVSNPKEEPVFVIEPIVEPEPAKEEPVAAEEPEHEEEPMDKEEEQAGDKPGGNVPMIDKWKKWLNGFIQDTDNED